jgi:hypothetical protein
VVAPQGSCPVTNDLMNNLGLEYDDDQRTLAPQGSLAIRMALTRTPDCRARRTRDPTSNEPDGILSRLAQIPSPARSNPRPNCR